MGRGKEPGGEKGRERGEGEVAGKVKESRVTLKMRGTREPRKMRREGKME